MTATTATVDLLVNIYLEDRNKCFRKKLTVAQKDQGAHMLAKGGGANCFRPFTTIHHPIS